MYIQDLIINNYRIYNVNFFIFYKIYFQIIKITTTKIFQLAITCIVELPDKKIKLSLKKVKLIIY